MVHCPATRSVLQRTRNSVSLHSQSGILPIGVTPRAEYTPAMRLQLKRLSPNGLDTALAKAEHYRDLNQPDEAESICRDVLDVAPDHARAIRTLGLALTDRFPDEWT